MTKLGDKPIEKKFTRMMNTVAITLDELFNGDTKGGDRKTGFILMVFPLGNTDGLANYISNANRDDVVTMLKEQVARFEGQPEKKG